MKILFHILMVVVAATLGLALGFVVRGTPASGPAAMLTGTSAESSTDSQSKLSRDSNLRAASPIRDDSPLATKLARDLSMSAGVTNWLCWFEAIEKASPSDFPRLFRLAQGNAAATRLVTDRWIELHPQHVFDTLVAATKEGNITSMRDLSYQFFREWSKRDPEAAIAALSGRDDFAMRSIWRHDVAAEVIRKNPERGLRLFSEWHIENFGPHMDGVAKWAAADPRHAAEFALGNPSGYVSQLAVETIGKEWAKVDPVRALEFAAGKPGELGSILAATVLKEWTGRSLTEAANWLATADARTRNRLSPSFVEAWGKTDANAAMAWCELNLTGSSLAQAVGGLVRGVAEKDLAAAAALVAALEPSSARTEAAVAISRKLFPDEFQRKPIKPESIAWLAGLDSESARRVMNEIQWQWSMTDPKGMADFLASSPERFPTQAYDTLARELARKSPLDALAWADRLPEERALAAGGEAFAEWRRTQPEAATKWLDALPSSDARRQPYLERSIRVLAWDAQTATQLASLSAADRATARSVIQSMQLPEDRRVSLLELLKSP